MLYAQNVKLFLKLNAEKNYQTNIKTQIYYGVRPSFIEVDDEKIYSTSGNRFQVYNFKTGISTNERYFPNQVTFFKKYKNFFFVAETNSSTTTFWFSNDNGVNFYKSNTTVPSVYQVRNIEAIGEKDLTLYFNFNYYGSFKGKLVFDFNEPKIFEIPFNYKNSNIPDSYLNTTSTNVSSSSIESDTEVTETEPTNNVSLTQPQEETAILDLDQSMICSEDFKEFDTIKYKNKMKSFTRLAKELNINMQDNKIL